MLKYKLLFMLSTLPASFAVFADCSVGSNFTSGYSMPTMNASTMNINKYEGTSVQSNVYSREVASANFDIFRVYTGCTVGTNRTILGNVFATNVTAYDANISRLNAYPALGIKVEMGDAPASGTLKTLNTTELAIYSYSGDTHGVKMRVTLYVLPRTSTMTSYPTTINVSNLRIATISLRRVSDNVLIPANTQIPVYLNATVNISESTCSLSQSSYTIALPDVSVRNLGLVGNETALSSSNTATLSINCANLNDGAGREIKAYTTDALNQSNATNILENQVGAGYATGVGIRLRDKNNAIISLDPNQSKSTNKWTFGNLSTAQLIQHVIKANYVRTANTVTPGLVRSQAYLNIVYD
ncbi:fimbrial protein [Acinetobacter sp. CE-15]|uniref:fimbrial protein n=1 Tax=Acinetobacter sp. CE-15 TaxID=3425693 RepID=UPI003DA66EA5